MAGWRGLGPERNPPRLPFSSPRRPSLFRPVFRSCLVGWGRAAAAPPSAKKHDFSTCNGRFMQIWLEPYNRKTRVGGTRCWRAALRVGCRAQPCCSWHWFFSGQSAAAGSSRPMGKAFRRLRGFPTWSAPSSRCFRFPSGCRRRNPPTPPPSGSCSASRRISAPPGRMPARSIPARARSPTVPAPTANIGFESVPSTSRGEAAAVPGPTSACWSMPPGRGWPPGCGRVPMARSSAAMRRSTTRSGSTRSSSNTVARETKAGRRSPPRRCCRGNRRPTWWARRSGGRASRSTR